MKMMNKIIKSLYCSLVILLLGLTSQSVQAAIYKCENASGKTFYADKPCPVNNTETELQAVKDPINGYIPPKFIPDEKKANESRVVIGLGNSGATQDNDNDSSETFDLNQETNNAENLLDNENGEQSGSDIANKQTESDKLFNQKLNKSSSKTATKSDVIGDILTLEPPG